MADDLIDRIHAAMTDVADPKLRALMAEVEVRLQTLPPAYPMLTQPDPPTPKPLIKLDDPGLTTALPRQYTRDTTHLKDYRPSSGEGYDEAVFLGTGDLDPLGHDELIRR